MAFLKKIGKVGGAANKDYRFAMGVDEGPVGKATSGSASASGVRRHCGDHVVTGYCLEIRLLFFSFFSCPLSDLLLPADVTQSKTSLSIL